MNIMIILKFSHNKMVGGFTLHVLGIDRSQTLIRLACCMIYSDRFGG